MKVVFLVNFYYEYMCFQQNFTKNIHFKSLLTKTILKTSLSLIVGRCFLLITLHLKNETNGQNMVVFNPKFLCILNKQGFRSICKVFILGVDFAVFSVLKGESWVLIWLFTFFVLVHNELCRILEVCELFWRFVEF